MREVDLVLGLGMMGVILRFLDLGYVAVAARYICMGIALSTKQEKKNREGGVHRLLEVYIQYP